MKWYSPFFCLLLFTACTNRSSIRYEHKRDSLWMVANDTILAERVRIEALAEMMELSKAHQDDSDSMLYVVASERYSRRCALEPGRYREWLAEFGKEVRGMGNTRYTSYFEAIYEAADGTPPTQYRLFDRLCREAEAAKDTAYVVYGRLRMAALENEAGDYSGSEETVTAALRYLNPQKNADAPYLESAFDLLGESYLSRDDFKKAMDYFSRALQFSTTFQRRLTHENNVAFTEIRMKDYDRAVRRLAHCLADNETKKYPREQARLLKNLGYAMFRLDPGKGEDQMLEALDIREKNGLVTDLPSSYMDLAEFHQIRRPELSVQYAKKADDVAAELQQIDDRLEALRFLAKQSAGNEALAYYRTLTELDDSIRTQRRKARNEFAHIRYEKSLAERRSERLAQEKTRQKWIAVAWASLAFSLLTVGVFIFYRFRKQRQLEAYQTETRLSRRLHDEVAGDLSKMMAFAETADLANDHNREKLLSGLDTVYGRTRDIAHSNADIATGDGFPGELRELMEVFQGQSQMIIVGFDAVPWTRLSAAKQIVVYRVIQELLTNMRKHSDAELVTLRFGLENRSLSVHYGDNGTQKGTRRPNGLRNVENRIRVVKGRFTFGFEDGKGFRASFTIPL